MPDRRGAKAVAGRPAARAARAEGRPSRSSLPSGRPGPAGHSGPSRPSRPSGRRVGLALAGGGPLGAIYEIGTLVALEEALPGLAINDLDGYVGVSAGALVAAGLANGMTPRQLCRAFIEGDGPAADRIHPSLFFRPALGEYAARLARLPALLAQAASGFAFGSAFGGPLGRGSWLVALERLGQALPTGLFSNAALRERLHEVFSQPGRTDDFRALQRRLVVVATDLDSGAAAPFGQPGWDSVPISQAVVASAALPGLFPPVPIEGLHGPHGPHDAHHAHHEQGPQDPPGAHGAAPSGQRRWYVDGALKKTLHARVLLDMGLDLVLCLNPLVPFDASAHGAGQEHRHHRVLGGAHERIPQLVRGGLPVVLSQTFRTLIHSRLELGMKGYEASHPGTDIVLFEPDQRDPTLFLANLFSYSQRRSLAEHAYQRTRADLRSRRGSLRPVLARHGLALDDAVLDDPARRLLGRRRLDAAAGRPERPSAQALRRLDEVLADLQRLLPQG
ncbi:MAG: patatin-like phospholipase family protein [Burkholderiales bacterium]|nr:patatin-like phospholipase family protein [Burkholderiales bacterium]